MLGDLYHNFIFAPILNALIFLQSIIPGGDIGIAIILLTILVRLILFPLSRKATRAQKEMAAIQPKIKDIQKKYKDNREEQTKQMMALYKEHKINPFAGIVPLLVQLPIMIALYQVLLGVFRGNEITGLYTFVQVPEALNATFLGFIDLSSKNAFIAVATGAAQFLHSKLIMGLQQQGHKKPTKSLRELAAEGKKPDQTDMSRMMGKQMMYIMPMLMMFISFTLPAGLPLYFLTTTLFSIGEFFLIRVKDYKKDMENSGKEEELVSES